MQSYALDPRGAEIDPGGLILFTCQVTALIVVWLFFALRMLVKVALIKRVTLDDWLMSSAMVSLTPVNPKPSKMLDTDTSHSSSSPPMVS